MEVKSDKRDMRDPTKLYARIMQIKKNNGTTFLKAADMADEMHHAQKNGIKK